MNRWAIVNRPLRGLNWIGIGERTMKQEMNDEELDRRAAIIINKFGGIHPPFEAFYIHSILYSAGRSSEAFQRFDVARSLNDTQALQVSSVHEGLGHAGALSRFFWQSLYGKESKARRQLKLARATKLRRAFDLTDHSGLRNRALRDFLEHFDERLDTYLLHHDRGYFFPSDQVGDSTLADEPDGHIFKLVDPGKSSFVLLGEKYDYSEVRKEVERIHKLALEMEKNGCGLEPSS